MTTAPALGVAHPLKIGKTLRSQRPSTRIRNLLALKFPHLPEGTNTNARGQLTLNDEKFTVELPTVDGTSAHVFSGPRKAQVSESRMSEYLLVYHDGAFWLERIADYANFLRHDGESSEPIQVDEPVEDEITTDPDSWMMDPELLSVSPITPEEEDMDDAPNEAMDPSVSESVPTRSTFAGKGVPGSGRSPFKNSVNRINGSGQRTARTLQIMPRSTTAAKQIAMKSIATKAPSSSGPSPTKDQNDSVPDHTEVVEEVVEEFEVDEEEPDNDDDQQSTKSSSSSGDDSDDSDSDSDSDSAAYTDSSSE